MFQCIDVKKKLEIYFSHLAVFSRACKNFNNTPGLDFVFRTRLLEFLETKIRTRTLWNFVSFFDVKQQF